MTKQTLIDPELKQVINFSNLNSLEEGLGIAIMRNWSEVSINDVPEDKIECVKKWVKVKQSQHRDIIIHIGRTYFRDWVINFSSIYALEKGFNRAVKEKLRKIIIDDVPEDQIKPIQNYIEKNKGKIEGVEVEIKQTLSGLTVEEEELFENEYSSMLAVDRTKLIKNKIERIQINLATEYIAASEPPRADAQLRWWEQKLEKAEAQDKINAAQLERENEAAKENEKTAKKLEDAQPLLEKHSHIGEGPRKHNSLLNNFIDNFDKEFSKNRKKEPTAELIARNLRKHLENHSTNHSFIINVEDENDNCIKWRDEKGNIKCSEWGDPMRSRINRIRKKRNKR